MKQIAVLVFKGENIQPLRPTAFDISEDLANAAYEEIEKMVQEGKVSVESGTVVVKDTTGYVQLRKTSEWTAKSGAGWGAFWGLLVGLILAGPLVGMLGGLGLGALLGRRATKGIDRDFMERLGESLMPGDAALFLLIDGDDQATLDQLESYEAQLYTTVLTDDVHEALEQASEHEEVLDALKLD